jgi:hypothetical protein
MVPATNGVDHQSFVAVNTSGVACTAQPASSEGSASSSTARARPAHLLAANQLRRSLMVSRHGDHANGRPVEPPRQAVRRLVERVRLQRPVGPRGRGATSVSHDGVRSIIEAMEKCGARRLIVITGSVVDDTGNGFLMRHVLKSMARRTFLRDVCADMRRAEDEIHTSNLDWTIFRPPRLTDKAPTGNYRIAIDRNVPRGVTIARADLADHILEVLDVPTSVRKHIFIAN